MPIRRRLSWLAAGLALLATYMLWFYATRLHTAEGRARQLIDATPVGIVVCNPAGSVVAVNEAICQMTGFTAADFATGGVVIIIPPEYRQAHLTGFANFVAELGHHDAASSKPYTKVFPVLCKDGKLVRAAVAVSSIAAGESYEFFAFITPVAPAVDDVTRNFPGPYKN